MMDIYEANDSFDFSGIKLLTPTVLQAGNYFTKIHYKNNPLYVQCPQSKNKQGFVTANKGKKIYIDLMFDQSQGGVFLEWIENLEQTLQKLIFEKREAWFSSELEFSDIENAFVSTVKIYKSAMYYLVRANVNTRLSIPVIKIFNELEQSVKMDDITPETNLISILEIQGVKFTMRSFEIQMEIKQIMVIQSNPFLDQCLIKGPAVKPSQPPPVPVDNHLATTTTTIIPLQENLNSVTPVEENIVVDEVVVTNESFGESLVFEKETSEKEEEEEEVKELEEDVKELEEKEEVKELEEEEGIDLEEFKEVTNEEGDLKEEEEEEEELKKEEQDSKEKQEEEDEKKEAENNNSSFFELGDDFMEEYDILSNFENISDDNNDGQEKDKKQESKFQIKPVNEIYHKLYSEAKKKAKDAKKNALAAFLEMQKIKNTYQLNYLNDDLDDDDDDEENGDAVR